MIASLKFTAKNEKDKKNLEIKVDAGVKAKVFSVGIGAQFKKLAESVKDISTLSISYKATIPLTTIPTDIDSLVKAIEDFPKVVSYPCLTYICTPHCCFYCCYLHTIRTLASRHACALIS